MVEDEEVGDECEYNEEWKRLEKVEMMEVVDEMKVEETADETQEVKKYENRKDSGGAGVWEGGRRNVGAE
jgi:hypothetical protein